MPFVIKFYFFNPTWFGTQSEDLARLPGFDPRQITMDAWQNTDIQNDPAEDILPYAIMAASYGDVEALMYAVEHLNWPDTFPLLGYMPGDGPRLGERDQSKQADTHRSQDYDDRKKLSGVYLCVCDQEQIPQSLTRSHKLADDRSDNSQNHPNLQPGKDRR